MRATGWRRTLAVSGCSQRQASERAFQHAAIGRRDPNWPPLSQLTLRASQDCGLVSLLRQSQLQLQLQLQLPLLLHNI